MSHISTLRQAYQAIGFESQPDSQSAEKLVDYANLKLAAQGCPVFPTGRESVLSQLGQSMMASLRQKNRLLADYLCPVDQSIHNFLASYLGSHLPGAHGALVPTPTLVLDRHGLARTLSLPPDRDYFRSELVESYRVHQGVLHNPVKDRRTTEGVFHVVQGGFPVPCDKKEVPLPAFARLVWHALRPPRELLKLPFTSSLEESAETFCSLLLRPLVQPEVPGYCVGRSMEIRFFAPGSLVSNLDFVESIFGNGGDPFLPENDARLDVENWSGHTGCVILAPHLVGLKKSELGLPPRAAAGEREQRDGMCWDSPDELYNDGQAFKVTCRDHHGLIVTLIADNYFGYCKKEVKAQISYACNLMGQCEEEHAGGAMAFPRFDLGEDFEPSELHRLGDHTFAEVRETYGDLMHVQPEGYGIDRQFDDIYYLPENVHILLRQQEISWDVDGQRSSIKLQPGRTYVLPSGHRIDMVKPEEGQRWRLVGTIPEGTLCHKPCTVSGGGKSEISKPITDAMIEGPIITNDFKRDFDMVEEIINRDYGDRYRQRDPGRRSRPLLSPARSLGSAVRMLTPSPEFTDTYNRWLSSIPRHVRDMVLIIKRFYKPDWGSDWRGRFSVDSINGMPGYELKYRKLKLRAFYQRVGFAEQKTWRTFSLRKDFYASEKLQWEDDISVSIVVPKDAVQHLHPLLRQPSYKFVQNCEYRLFQRPDEAIVRGYDKVAEADFSQSGNFFANYEPLSRDYARQMVEDTILFDQFSPPIRQVIKEFVQAKQPEYCVSTSHPRVVDGVPSKNPRYLQNRPDLENTRSWYLADVASRLFRRVPPDRPVLFPVNAVLPGRRNNPPDRAAGIRPLAVYNPIHYQELPELFMEFVSSLTGKSPSTTGAGSEGAMTKGPFNSMPAVIDLNNALVSYLLTGDSCYTTSAGYIGPKYRVDHDISLIIPEVWSRMFIHEREPKYLIENGFLDKLEDFDFEGRHVLQSRLGYRINERFVSMFFGRMFSDPTTVFTPDMLAPELQSLDDYVDGIDNIVATQNRIARGYFEDGTVELACPPIRSLLHMMAFGDDNGLTVKDPEFRRQWSFEALTVSDWYRQRLEAKALIDQDRWQHQLDYLRSYLDQHSQMDDAERTDLQLKIGQAESILEDVCTPAYIDRLQGTIGADPAVLPDRTGLARLAELHRVSHRHSEQTYAG
ncbi:MAG: hypothetical protein U0795_25900 [Pirellulales bacterium]